MIAPVSTARAAAAAVALSTLFLTGAAHAMTLTTPGATSLALTLNVTAASTIGEIGGQEVDTALKLPAGFAATANVVIDENCATGQVATTDYAAPQGFPSGSFVQTLSTAQFPVAIQTSLGQTLASVNSFGATTTTAAATVTQEYNFYPSIQKNSYGFENLVLSEEITNATCEGFSCAGFDEVVQITIPGLTPASAAAITASNFSSVGAIVASAEDNNLPITFDAYARDYTQALGQVICDGKATLAPVYTSLKGYQFTGTASMAVPEPMSVTLFASALLSLTLLRRRLG